MEIEAIALIPKPQSLKCREGRLLLRPDSTISWSGEGAGGVAELLGEYLRPATGFELAVAEGFGGTLHLEAAGLGVPDDAGFVDERYTLCIDDRTACLKAPNAAGLARGIQTLRQLFPPAILHDQVQAVEWTLPALEIEDEPRFRWRGQHLDVSRHFFNVDEVCRFIDLLALHRLNMCHLHLTDDQGWRIEIKQYPRLTEVGSRRNYTLIGHQSSRPHRFDDAPYGGFYTQDDIRAIVAFAARRHITLVPEIDMPGHMAAAIAAYPELGNTGAPVEVRCIWGISQHILNAEEATVTMMKSILDEVMALFPSKFIHIGGDEALKHEWNESRRAQERMVELGLRNANELQSWFIREIDRHIIAAGRRLIGWDEILEGGLAQGAAVMSWRNTKGGVEAAKQGHDVVMAVNEYLYFNNYQAEPTADEPLAIGGLIKLDKVYAYEPIPAELPAEYHQHVLGAQGQLWTEYIANMAQLEYMGFPRICALSEVLWDKTGLKVLAAA